MADYVTDPELIKRLDAAMGGSTAPDSAPAPGGATPGPATDPELIARLDAAMAKPAPSSQWNAGDETVNGLLFGQAPRAQAALDALGYKPHAPLLDIPKLLGYESHYKPDAPPATLQDYQERQAAFAKEHPYQTAAADAVGSVPGLMAGAGAVNAGIRAAGTLGPRAGAVARFLLGEAGTGREATTAASAVPGTALPTGERVASLLESAGGKAAELPAGGRLTSLGTAVDPAAGLPGYGLRTASRTASLAREGAQAGLLTSGMDEGDDIMQRLKEGAYTGAGAALLTPPALRTLALPAAAVAKGINSLMPVGERMVQKALGAGIGGMGLIEAAPSIWHMAAANPHAAAAVVGFATASKMANYLANHPEQRDALLRGVVRPTAELATNESLRHALKNSLFPPPSGNVALQANE